ncbi:MAG: hypothetical protein WBC11_06410, partial [Dehalococcoidia bacterium]
LLIGGKNDAYPNTCYHTQNLVAPNSSYKITFQASMKNPRDYRATSRIGEGAFPSPLNPLPPGEGNYRELRG